MKNKTTLFLLLFLVLVVIVPLLIVLIINISKGGHKENLLDINYNVTGNTTKLNKYKTDNPLVAMYIENYGSIVMELYPDKAPNTVKNFIALTKNGFYDNNTFHRLVPGFVLQGGDPTGTGTGGPNYTIKGEFDSNNIKNDLKHKEKIVSMARGDDNDSAGSQFFIMLANNSSLDGNYAAFGKVIDGWSNIVSIVENEAIADQNQGTLSKNLTIKKALVDTRGKEYEAPKTIVK
ncbi:MAG: peptidylprolyl isomerase [Bacilli bacterium]|nr:peptidylprolyl isomerase [Bacilli bacterium]